MATSISQPPRKPYLHDKTPFVQKHVLGAATVKIKYADMAKNFAPKVMGEIEIGDYVADISTASCSGKCLKIGKHRSKKGIHVTIAKALKNNKNKQSRKNVCVKAHDIKSFVQNKRSKQWYCVKAHKSSHVECYQVFEIPGLNYDDPVEVGLDDAGAESKGADESAAKSTKPKPNKKGAAKKKSLLIKALLQTQRTIMKALLKARNQRARLKKKSLMLKALLKTQRAMQALWTRNLQRNHRSLSQDPSTRQTVSGVL